MKTPIQFHQVSKKFDLSGHDSLVQLLLCRLQRCLGKGQLSETKTFWALREVSFAVDRGQALGIIGPNGAGKSTILKLLAGILRADEGVIAVCGRKASLIEVGAGFHGDLTGRENIYLNATLMGMSRVEVRRKLAAIVEFAGVDRFLDMPVKRYSSGMYARLGFSIAAHLDPEVLLVDEVLSVGDAMFRVRCLERMRELVQGGTALVFVTHDLEQMRAICNKAIVLHQGRVTHEGTPSDAVAHYFSARAAMPARQTDIADHGRSGCLRLQQLRVRDGFGNDSLVVGPDHFLRLELQLHCVDPREVAIELNLRRAQAGDNVASFNSARSGRIFHTQPGENQIVLDLPGLPVRGGQYFWNVRAWDAASGATLLDTPFVYPMLVDDGGRTTGILSITHDWTHVHQPAVTAHWVAPSGDFTKEAVLETADEDLLPC